jgi:hypothetical protein
MTAVEYLDRLPPGWFALDVMREEARKRGWVALVVDINPDDLKTCICDFPALFYVNPKEHRPGARRVVQGWLRIPGEHRNADAAWDALEGIIATRH